MSASASAASAESRAPEAARSRIAVNPTTQPSKPLGASFRLARLGCSAQLRAFGDQPAGAGARPEPRKMREVGGIVDIQGDAGQVQYRRRNAARLGGGEMREETVLAKAQLHRIGRRHEDRVRAALVMRRNDREGGRRAVRGNNPDDLR